MTEREDKVMRRDRRKKYAAGSIKNAPQKSDSREVSAATGLPGSVGNE